MITCALNDACERFLAQTFYAVEATSFERHCLWADHSRDTLYPRVNPRTGKLVETDSVKWEELNPGGIVTVGALTRARGTERLPVSLSVTFARIEGRVVLFYESTSIVTDSEQAEKWLAKHCPCWKPLDGHCDANNFAHCLNAIEAANAL